MWAELNTVNLAKQIIESEIVTYRQQETEHLFLADILYRDDLKDSIFVVSWGFDVPKLIAKLAGKNIIYHAHSAGYNFNLSPNIPIISVSRNTMGYWGRQAPSFFNLLSTQSNWLRITNLNLARDIDVLVQTRKSSRYVLKQLIPALQSRCQIRVLDGYVEDLAGSFNRSKIYLYDSAEYWAVSAVTEGFGLPPLEALACGCQVFSSLDHGLADYLDPGFNCHKIAGYALDYGYRIAF